MDMHRPTEPGIAGSSPAEVNGIWIHPAPIKDSNSHYITVSQCMDTYRHVLKNMCMPGVEPGAQAWEACMLPLHYMRFCTKYDFDRFFCHAALLTPHITLTSRNVPDGHDCVDASLVAVDRNRGQPRSTSHLRSAPLLAYQAGSPMHTQATYGWASTCTHT